MPRTQKTLQRQTFKDLSAYNLRWVFCSGISTSQVTSVNGPELIIVLYTHSYSGFLLHMHSQSSGLGFNILPKDTGNWGLNHQPHSNC